MTTYAPTEIESLSIEIIIPSNIDSPQFKVLQSIAEECSVKLNL